MINESQSINFSLNFKTTSIGALKNVQGFNVKADYLV